jgi:sorbitol-6-phosphate 2-dehydrogenase
MSWTDLTDKVVIITGGAAGIGLAVAKGFVEVGAKVVIADFAEDVGANAVIQANESGDGEAIFAKCDVTSGKDVEAMVKKAVERFGSVDVLVNNAGINVPRLLVDPAGKEELTEDVWDKVFAVNVKGQFLCAQAAARVMLEQDNGGVLINMSSESGLEGSEGQSVYAATKAANQNLTRSWAKELGTQGVRVIGVAPGIMETTGMRSDAYEQSLAYTRGISVDELRTKYGSTSSIPLGRSGKLSEVSDLVVFLASKRASYLHGTTVNISGGKSRG